MQKRALFFVFDGGTGVGHLRRLCHIAREMQGPFACLIVTGHRAAAHWFVPPACEYVHLPAWDSLLADKADYWGRAPFLSVSPDEALALRRSLIGGIVNAFRPDAIVVDHLPLGMRDELEAVVAETPARKYLVTRGVQNETEDLDRLLLGGAARAAIRDHYDRVLVAADPRVFDFAGRYPALDELAGKFRPVGYVAEPVDARAIADRRTARGLAPDQAWVVASAGGGQLGETLVAASCALAERFPAVAFDVVLGPRSRSARQALVAAPNLQVHDQAPDMALLHAAADVVVCSGGYNSLLEAAQGRARILCIPSRKSERDEQYTHAMALKAMVDTDVSLDVADLPAMLERVLARAGSPVTDRRDELDMTGAATIARTIAADVI